MHPLQRNPYLLCLPILQFVSVSALLNDIGSGYEETTAAWCNDVTCEQPTPFCCENSCCTKLYFSLWYGSRTEESWWKTTEVNDDYLCAHCETIRNSKQSFCCQQHNTCCEYQSKVSCLEDWMYNTGVSCPPDWEPEKTYCCDSGRSCCTRDEKQSEAEEPKSEVDDHSGNNSIGAIAGFAFLAVIVLGALLTLATRYLKVKVRRYHSRAGIHSQEYINARNRRSIEHDDNDGGATGTAEIYHLRPLPGVSNRHPNAPAEIMMEDEDEVCPPPSYQEAIASCPVVLDDNVHTDEVTPSTQRHQHTRPNPYQFYRGLVRPPSRGQSDASFGLSPVFFKTPDPTGESRQSGEVTTYENATITLPKPEDSCV